MTIACSGDPTVLDQIIKQLDKLVDVVRAVDHTGGANYESEIALIKLRCGAHERTEILQIAEHFSGKVVDYATESIMLRVYGSSEKLDALIALLRSHEIAELVRSGKILMARGAEAT
jgi:acetolactate synthase-1/3 small subunit